MHIPVTEIPQKMPHQIPANPHPPLKVSRYPVVKPTTQKPMMLNHIREACRPRPLQVSDPWLSKP